MASHTISSEQSLSQSSDLGERAKSQRQQSMSHQSKNQLNGKENQPPRAGTPAAPLQPQRSGTGQIHESVRRRNKYQKAYQAFIAAAEQRRVQRKKLETRNKVWNETKTKYQARIAAIDQERQSLLQKLNTVAAAKDDYNRHHGVHATGEQDERAKQAWEAYFNLETDRLEV